MVIYNNPLLLPTTIKPKKELNLFYILQNSKVYVIEKKTRIHFEKMNFLLIHLTEFDIKIVEHTMNHSSIDLLSAVTASAYIDLGR